MADELAAMTKADFVSVDQGNLGASTNHRIVWRSLHNGTTAHWLVVLEEDAVPVNDFRAQLAEVLRVAPTPIVSLYLGKQRPPRHQGAIQNALARADSAGAQWITSNQLLHAVGVAVRTILVPDMLANLPVLPIDQAISKWARAHRYQIGYCIPSLVQHRDGPSLISHPDGKARVPGRVAWRVGTRPRWSSVVVPL